MIHVRIVGRTLRPGCINTRRLFLGLLGVDVIRVPRNENPFSLARRIRRYLHNEDLLHLKRLVRRRKATAPAGHTAANEDNAAAAE